jgi:hypothetical protein
VRSRTYSNWPIAFLFVLSGAATHVIDPPPRARGSVELGDPVSGTEWTLDEILAALRHVETGGAPDDGRNAIGDGGRAIGPYQIHQAYWQDAGLPGAFEDCRDPSYARAVVLAYWQRYCPRALSDLDAETLVRIHNGGPKGDKKEATFGFWRRVETTLVTGRAKS